MKTQNLRTVKTLSTLLLTLCGLAYASRALSWHGFTFAEWWKESRSGCVLWRADTREKLVALTFDDGPSPANTARVLDILERYNAHATFFLEGKQVREFPDLARSIEAHGHVIGNHTYSHPYLDRLPAAKVHMEITACEQTLEQNLHIKSHLFRPPRGEWNPTIYREARRDGDDIILWSVALEHHEAHTPRAMADRTLRLIRPGGIVLLHDGGTSREATLQALPLLLDGLRKRGYRCVTIPELLHIRGDDSLPNPSADAPPSF